MNETPELSDLFLHQHSVPGVEADNDQDDQHVPWDFVKREVGGELKQVLGDVGGEVVVEGLLGDVNDGVPGQDDLEGVALSLVAQHHKQDADLSNIFPAKESKQKTQGQGSVINIFLNPHLKSLNLQSHVID